MIIKLLLCGILFSGILFAIMRRGKAPLVAWVMMALSFVGMLLVIFPNVTMVIANDIGLGRGTDLVIYLFMAIMMVVILDIYLRWQNSLEKITVLARHIALLEARLGSVDEDRG